MIAATTSNAYARPHVYNVLDAPYGALGDAAANDRAAIQAAIDAAATDGGGVVLLPDRHMFLSGNLVLRDNVTLQIDGVLLESQDPAHYTYQVLLGHNRPPTDLCQGGSCQWDHAFYHNLPFIYAAHSKNVGVSGSGMVQMRWATEDEFGFSPPLKDDHTIHSLPIGLFDVQGFSLRDVSIIDAHTYNVGLLSVSDGLVDHIRIVANHQDIGSDGIAIQNSQHVRITNSTLNPNDDAVYIWSSYRDPRAYQDPAGGQLWWSSDVPRPSHDIEVDHNVIRDRCCKAVGLIAWANGAPNAEDVEMYNISVHDNILNATEAVGIWGDNPNHGEVPFTNNEVGDQSPVRDVRIWNNVYRGNLTNGSLRRGVFTSLKTEFGLLGTGQVQNPGFDDGTAWWTRTGAAGTGSDQRFDGHVGYVSLQGGHAASLQQGLGLNAGHYTVSADIAVDGGAAKLVIRDTCGDVTLGERVVDSATKQTYELAFNLVDSCDDIEVGIEKTSGSSRGTAWIDGVGLRAA